MDKHQETLSDLKETIAKYQKISAKCVEKFDNQAVKKMLEDLDQTLAEIQPVIAANYARFKEECKPIRESLSQIKEQLSGISAKNIAVPALDSLAPLEIYPSNSTLTCLESGIADIIVDKLIDTCCSKIDTIIINIVTED